VLTPQFLTKKCNPTNYPDCNQKLQKTPTNSLIRGDLFRRVQLGGTIDTDRKTTSDNKTSPPAKGFIVDIPHADAWKIRWLAAIATAVGVCASANFCWAAERVKWATGAELQKRLAQPVSIVWQNNPLRNALAGVSRSQRVAILLDRRADPGQKLDLKLTDTPLHSVLQTIADRCGLEVTRLKDVVYFGPPAAAAQLRPLSDEFAQAARRLPKTAQRKFFLSRSMAWEDLSTPRDLLTELARQNDLELVGLDRVPHDLWAAADLSPMTLVDRLSLIAVQFDLGFQIGSNGRRLELVPARGVR
jgi:hypothetical protein